jgi:cytochrome c biogenesis protein CcmG, thiol:disulfide interchange protein DsbE
MTSDIDPLLMEEPQSHTPRKGFGLGSVVLLIGVLMVAGVFGLALVRQNQTQPESGPAPDFVLTTLEGSEMKLSALSGNVVVINFWASWCGPCRDEAPALEAVWQRYQDQGVVVMGVAYTDTESDARAFMDEFNATYPVGLDVGTRISELYNIQGVPETFIVDRDGRVVRFYKMPISEAELSRALDEVLERGT